MSLTAPPAVSVMLPTMSARDVTKLFAGPWATAPNSSPNAEIWFLRFSVAPCNPFVLAAACCCASPTSLIAADVSRNARVPLFPMIAAARIASEPKIVASVASRCAFVYP